MSKAKNQITLEEYQAMTEEQKQELSAAEMARLEREQKQADLEKERKAEAEVIREKYRKQAPNGVFCLVVDDAKAWLKNLDRKIVSMVASSADKDPVYAAELILENCWLEGDERIKDDDEYFLEAITLLQQLRTSKVGTIKKY